MKMTLPRFFLEVSAINCILVLILMYAPGIPPHGTYEYHELAPPLERQGALAPNKKLNGAVRLFENVFNGPESIASRGKDGELFVSMHGGNIVKVFSQYKRFLPIVKMGSECAGYWEEKKCGRPLGLRFSRSGKLLVADAYFGIFSVDVDKGTKEMLVDANKTIAGNKPRLIDDLDEDKEGNIYWSDASYISSLDEAVIECFAGPTGRLIRRDAKTGQNLVLIDKLHFSNGVQLSQDEDFVLVCETWRRRVLRYWLKGSNVGRTDVFVSGLPGFPDNIRRNPAGGYYVSLVSLTNMDLPDGARLLMKFPALQRLISRLSYGLWSTINFINGFFENETLDKMAYNVLNLKGFALTLSAVNKSMVLSLDENGNVSESFEGDNGAVVSISETHRIKDKLFFGSPYSKYLGMLDLSLPSKTEIKSSEGKKKTEL